MHDAPDNIEKEIKLKETIVKQPLLPVHANANGVSLFGTFFFETEGSRPLLTANIYSGWKYDPFIAAPRKQSR
jgi:hypothetical protein